MSSTTPKVSEIAAQIRWERNDRGVTPRLRHLQQQRIVARVQMLRSLSRIVDVAVDKAAKAEEMAPKRVQRKYLLKTLEEMHQKLAQQMYSDRENLVKEVRDSLAIDLKAEWMPGQAGWATNLGTTPRGFVPPPRDLEPPPISDSVEDVEDVLAATSGMLATNLGRYQRDPRRWLIDRPLPAPDYTFAEAIKRMQATYAPMRLIAGLETTDPHWVRKLRTRLGLPTGAPRRDRAGEPERRTVGSEGLARAAQTLLRHEVLTAVGQDRDMLRLDFPQVYAGFQLFHIESDQSRESHAANHKNRYYVDDRPGAAAKWKNRLVPPYEPNCICYTVELWRDDVPLPVEAQFQVFFRNTAIIARDGQQWAEWFDSQSPKIKQLLVGAERYEAVRGRKRTAVRYEDFIDGRGWFLQPKTLEKRSPERLREARQTLKKSQEWRQLGWQRYGSILRLSVREEVQMEQDIRRLFL